MPENNENRDNNGMIFRGGGEGNLTCRKLTAAQGVKDQREKGFSPFFSQVSGRGMCKVILSPDESFCLPRIPEQGDADLSGIPALWFPRSPRHLHSICILVSMSMS